jgi:threonylcarbamoyladenosine tRNA methylthiotransferase MtaB
MCEKKESLENKFVSLGCRLNYFESELIKSKVNKLGIDGVIVVNTCTVTKEAHKQSIQNIKKLKKENPNHKMIVTGCAVQSNKNEFESMKEVDKIIGNSDKLLDSSFTSSDRIIFNDFTKENSFLIDKIQSFENRCRAFIQIQQGCDHRCSFCIIPAVRGGSKSLAIDDIVSQIRQVVEKGHLEVVLTGVDISSWNRDVFANNDSKLGYLCKVILKEVPKLKRLRLSSMDPAILDNDIFDLLKNEERFMPHIHLSLQSMNDSVLRNMGRRHSKGFATEYIQKLKEINPNITIGADIIVGFPRESDEQFIDTCESIKELAIPLVHVFAYSERDGTKAMEIKPSVPLELRKKRSEYLRNIVEENKKNFYNNQIARNTTILLEKNNMGYTDNYCLSTIVNGESLTHSKIYNVEIMELETDLFSNAKILKAKLKN